MQMDECEMDLYQRQEPFGHPSDGYKDRCDPLAGYRIFVTGF